MINDDALPTPLSTTLDLDAVADWPTRVAAHALGIGLVLAVLVALPVAPSDLDRHQLPKELAVHLFVWLAAVLVRPRAVVWPSIAIRSALALLLVGSITSAALATNPWLGLRATALTFTGSVAFLLAHHLATRHSGTLLAWVGIGAGVAAITGLAQAWGAESALFATLRAPGGTLGNRNFVGHLSAIALPTLTVLLVTARRHRSAVVAGCGIAILLGILMLTRSRAAWLGAIAGMGITTLGLLLARRRGGLPLPGARVVLAASAVAVSLVLAFGVPNTLAWRSDSPYLDTLTGVANFQEGSGRGRVLQYRRSLQLAATEPLTGVGPGNWPIRYGDVAPSSDPSWSFNDVIPLNPWPSSDWMALASERGVPGVLAVLLLAIGLGWRAWRAIQSGGPRGAAGTALLGTLLTTAVVGSFDAVLLLPVPLLLVGMATGSWLSRASDIVPPPVEGRWRWWPVVLVLLTIGGVRSAQQVAGYMIAGDGSDRGALRWAARVDPVSYPIRMALARRGPCRESRPHIEAVQRLAPTWPAVVQVRRRCR